MFYAVLLFYVSLFFLSFFGTNVRFAVRNK